MPRSLAREICWSGMKRREDRLDLAIDLKMAALVGINAMIVKTKRMR
jgi:hypothetical protein